MTDLERTITEILEADQLDYLGEKRNPESTRRLVKKITDAFWGQFRK